MTPLSNPILPFNAKDTILNIAEVRPYTTKELCNIYKISDKTLHKWLQPFRKKMGIKRGRYYTVAQVGIIFTRLGIPFTIIQADPAKLTA